MDYVVHVAFIIHVARYNTQLRITLHMHGDITYHECECMVENQHCVWCLIGWAWYLWMKSNRVSRLNEMIKKTCVR